MSARHHQLHHRSVFQFHQPAFWVFVAFLVYGMVRMVGALVQLSAISRSGWALSWLLLALYAAPLFLLIYYLDLYEREPLSVAFAAFLWGAFAATALALDAGGWDQVLAQVAGPEFAARWAPALTAPVVEEFLKGAGIVLLYLIVRDEIDDVMDGFVYGALCGLGFAVVEDVLYFMAAFGGTPAGVLQGFYVRVLSSGLYGHVLYSGLVGMAIGLVVSRREPRAGPRTPPGRRRDRRARGPGPLPVELADPDVRADAADRGGRVADPAARSGGQGIAPAVVRGDGAAPGAAAGAAVARRRAGRRGRRSRD